MKVILTVAIYIVLYQIAFTKVDCGDCFIYELDKHPVIANSIEIAFNVIYRFAIWSLCWLLSEHIAEKLVSDKK